MKWCENGPSQGDVSGRNIFAAKNEKMWNVRLNAAGAGHYAEAVELYATTDALHP